MLFFLLLLGCVTVLLWGVPQYRRSRNRNLIALRASGTGCLSLVLLLVVGFLLLLILRLPLSILPLFLIAFCTLPLIAGVFAAFLAVKISRRVGLEGPPPSVRAILCYFLFGLIGVTIWVGGRCLEMRRVKETWAVEYAVPTAGIRKIAVCQRLLNPVFERYEGTLKVVGADGSTRTLAFPPDRMDGRRVVNLYGLTKVPDLQQPLFLFADGVSAYLAPCGFCRSNGTGKGCGSAERRSRPGSSSVRRSISACSAVRSSGTRPARPNCRCAECMEKKKERRTRIRIRRFPFRQRIPPGNDHFFGAALRRISPQRLFIRLPGAL